LCWCSVFVLVGSSLSLSQAIWIVSSMVFVVLVCVFVRALSLFPS
jgi:NhaP-type Na+/H+ or K+/H+ antiporter